MTFEEIYEDDNLDMCKYKYNVGIQIQKETCKLTNKNTNRKIQTEKREII